MQEIAKTLMVLGAVLLCAGFLLFVSQKSSFFGRLPGDILVEKKNFTIYIPLATSLFLSLIVTLIALIWHRH